MYTSAHSPVRSTFATTTSAGDVAANALVELEKGLMMEKTRNAEVSKALRAHTIPEA
jgi:hypothetical protein